MATPLTTMILPTEEAPLTTVTHPVMVTQRTTAALLMTLDPGTMTTIRNKETELETPSEENVFHHYPSHLLERHSSFACTTVTTGMLNKLNSRCLL